MEGSFRPFGPVERQTQETRPKLLQSFFPGHGHLPVPPPRHVPNVCMLVFFCLGTSRQRAPRWAKSVQAWVNASCNQCSIRGRLFWLSASKGSLRRRRTLCRFEQSKSQPDSHRFPGEQRLALVYRAAASNACATVCPKFNRFRPPCSFKSVATMVRFVLDIWSNQGSFLPMHVFVHWTLWVCIHCNAHHGPTWRA